MSRARVFVVQQPTGRDAETGAIRPTMDLSPALEYGELRHVLRDSANPHRDPQALADEARRVMEAEGFGPEDWVLLVGNPALIGIVAAEAAFQTGMLRLLQWNRAARRYLPVEVQIDTGDGTGDPG